VSELPSGWALSELQEVTEISPKFSAELPEDTLVHFVPMAAVAEDFGGIDVSQLRPLREVRKGYTSFAEGDVLFAKITPCMENGKGALVPKLLHGQAFGSTEFHVMRPSAAISSEWLAHYLSQPDFRKVARHNMTGTAGQLRVPTKWLQAVQLPIPPRAEQTRIVEKLEALLGDLDTAVAELKAAQHKLASLRQSLLKAAVDGALTAEWRAAHGKPQEAGADLLQRILRERRARWETKQLAKFAAQGKTPPKGWQAKYPEPVAPDTTDLPQLPEGWVWASLGQCFHVAVGATPSRKEPGYWNGDVPWVSSGEVRFCRISSTKESITQLGLENSSTQINPRGSVLLGMIGEGRTRGQVAILDIEAANNQNCAAIWVSETELPPEYVYFWLWSRYEQTRKGSSGNNQPALNKSIVESIPLPLPPLAEQHAIIEQLDTALSACDTQQAAIDHALQQAAAQRRNLLKTAFAGQLVPQDPTDEPASELLARIRAAKAQMPAAHGRKRAGANPAPATNLRNTGTRSRRSKETG